MSKHCNDDCHSLLYNRRAIDERSSSISDRDAVTSSPAMTRFEPNRWRSARNEFRRANHSAIYRRPIWHHSLQRPKQRTIIQFIKMQTPRRHVVKHKLLAILTGWAWNVFRSVFFIDETLAVTIITTQTVSYCALYGRPVTSAYTVERVHSSRRAHTHSIYLEGESKTAAATAAHKHENSDP